MTSYLLMRKTWKEVVDEVEEVEMVSCSRSTPATFLARGTSAFSLSLRGCREATRDFV